MWLSEKMAEQTQKQPAADLATVTGGSAAQGRSEYRDFSLIAPWGIAYQPPDASRAVLVESTKGMVCAGTVVDDTDLKPGELLLFSEGGACIHLKNSGEVVINGQVFAAKGAE